MAKSNSLPYAALKPAFTLLPDPEPQQLQVPSKQDHKQPRRSGRTETPRRRVFHWVEHSTRHEREKRKQISTHVMHDYVERKKSRIKRSARSSCPRFKWVEKRQTVAQNTQPIPSIPHQTLSGTRSTSSPSPRDQFARKSPPPRIEAKPRPNEGRRRWPHRAVKARPQPKNRQRPLGNENVSLSLALRRSMSPNLSMFSGFGNDPFQTLPARCGKDEEAVLHTYFNILPECLYGIRKDAAINPQRDMVFPQSYVHPAIFQWVLVSASSYHRGRGGTLDASYVFRRRGLAYRLTNEWIRDPKKQLSDEMVLAVTAAVMVESRYGDPLSIPLHVEGLKTILNKRGGINSLVGKPWHSCVIQGLHLAGSGLGMVKSVYDIKEMRQHADVLIETLRNIQEFDLDRRRQWPQSEQKSAPPTTSTIPIANISRISSSYQSDSLLKAYASCRSRSFAPGSPLYTILSLSYCQYHSALVKTPNSSYSVSQHCFIAVLLSLNMAIWKYHNDFEAGIYYLTTLTRKLKVNSLFDKKGTIANIETLNWFLVMGGNDIRGRNGEWVQEEFLTKWAVINAMGVIARLESETRGAVLEALYGFLVDCETGSDENDMESEEDIPRRPSELSAEVLEAIRAQFMP